MIALWFFVFCFHPTTSQWSDEVHALIGSSLVSIGDKTVPVMCNRYGMNPCLQACEATYSEPTINPKVRECQNTELKTENICLEAPPKKYGPNCKDKLGCLGWNRAANVRIPTSPAPVNYAECVLTCDEALHHYCSEECVKQEQKLNEFKLTADDIGSDQKCILDALKTLSQCLKDAVRAN